MKWKVFVGTLCALGGFGINADAATPVDVAPPQAESTRRMVERLKRIDEMADPRTTLFQNAKLAELMRKSMGSVTNLGERLSLGFQLGTQLLKSGHTVEALNEFQTIEDLMARAGVKMEGPGRIGLRMQKALANLRLGEQENCLLNHNADSCIFPLQPGGFHQLPRGSRAAINLLDEELAEFPDDLTARWLLNLAHMTLGEYPDKVPSKFVIPPKVFASDYDLPRFPDVAGAIGLDRDGLAGGCILDDFDNDGFIDVMISNWALDGQLRYFHNDGDGHFTDRTVQAGLMGIVGGLNIQQTDYNNDGFLDVWMLRGAWLGKPGRMPASLLRNNGNGTFTDVTEEAGISHAHPTQTSVWFDYDGDGWLDVFIGNESTDPTDPEISELYHNNHDGTFTECAASCGLAVNRMVKGVTSADYDNDGRPDLYISCRDTGPNLLFHNDGADSSGHWKFSEAGARAGLGVPIFSFPTWFFDYDNDGWEDLFVSGYHIQTVGDIAADYLGLPFQGARARLFHNNRDGTFSDVTDAAHLNHVYLTMGCNFGDLDNDGWLDFYLGTGDPELATLIPNRMLRNAGGKYFQDVTTSGGFGHLQKGHGIAFADIDNDGDQDVFIVIGGAVSGDNYRSALFLNPGNTNHWLKLKLEGVKSNRAAIGARIKVNAETPQGPRVIYKTVNSGGSFGSSPLLQTIGLGNATAIKSVEVFWPSSGLRQKIAGVALDRAYHIREGDPSATEWTLKRIEFDLKAAHPHVHKS